MCFIIVRRLLFGENMNTKGEITEQPDIVLEFRHFGGMELSIDPKSR